MKNFVQLILVLFFCLLMSACIDSASPKDNPSNFFDVSDFVDSEAKRLNALDLALTKVAKIDGNSETKVIQDIDWEAELTLFKELEINKPALWEKYEVTITDLRGEANVLTYVAKDHKQKVQSLNIHKDGERVIKIIGEISSDNPLYQSSKRLEYYPNWGYKMIGRQDVVFLAASDFKIEASFKL